ncbi:MAG TPA: response regulator [Kofleriaceae bacterium]|nr:response regulator [Kofleriaceae bacterium]
MADEALYILLVDDDSNVRDTVRRQLSRVPRWHIAEVDSAPAALEHCGRYRVDVVVSDFDMPGMTGLELLELLRVAHPSIVRLLLTGHDDLHLCLHALNQGVAHRFVCKPWDHVDLRTVVRDSLEVVRGAPRRAV